MKSNHSLRTKSKFNNDGAKSNFRGNKFGSRGSSGRYKPDNSRFFSKNRRRNPYRDAPLKEEMYIQKAIASEEVSIYDKAVTFSDFNLHQKLLQNIV